MGGLSGPAIRPIAVRMVWECFQAVKLPILGMGGIATIDDALEFIIAGASAVQVGTANFVDPLIWGKLIAGLDDYMTRHNIARVADLVGSLQIPEGALVNRILVALDVPSAAKRRWRWPTRCAAPSAASRSAASCSPRPGPASCARWSPAAIACSSI